MASAQAISLTDASEGDVALASDGDGDMMACKACDHLLPLLERGVACGVRGEEGLRFGLITGDDAKARARRERLEGVVVGLVGWEMCALAAEGEVAVLFDGGVRSPTTFSVMMDGLFDGEATFALYFFER